MILGAALLAGGHKRRPTVHLAAFLLLIGANQAIESYRFIMPAEAFEPWIAVAAMVAMFDPLFILLFAATFSPGSRLAKPPVLIATLALSAALAILVIPWQRPGFGWELGTLYQASGRIFTTAVYALVLFEMRGSTRKGPAYPILTAAMTLATIPSAVRSGEYLAWLHPGQGSPPVEAAAARAASLASVALALALVWALARGSRKLAPTARRWLWGGILLALAFSWGILAATMGFYEGALIPQELGGFEGAGGAFVALRWILIGLLLSFALLRHDVLALPLEARRRTALVWVGGLALAGGLLAFVVVSAAFPGLSTPVALAQAALAGLILAASRPFRRAAGRLATAAYGVPMPVVGVEALERYRNAVAVARRDGKPVDGDAGFAALREELGLDAHTAAFIERATLPSSRDARAPGTILASRYVVLRALARGGSSRTFLARDTRAGADVVVKEIVGNPSVLRAARREARLAAGTRHPHVLAILDVVDEGDALLLVSEHAEGGSLAERLDESGLEDAVAILDGILAGLEAVHAAGVTHRDVKPSNVLLDAHGNPKIADFGVASAGLEKTIAFGGAPIGTPAWMAPEQRRGEPATPATDVHAVGLLMRAMAHALPPALGPVRDRALREDPRERYADAGRMRAAVREALANA